MRIITSYKRIKHGYVRKLPNGDLRLSIPWRKRFDIWFKNRLIEKWQKLWTSHATKQKNTIVTQKDTTILIWWSYVPISTCPTPIENHLKQLCFEEAKVLTDIYSQRLGYTYGHLRIKKVRTKRWSCSSKQNINLNMDLVHLPKKYLEYVVIHEVCHLKHKHHQKAFRDEVAWFLPEYKQIVKEMKKITISRTHQ